MNDKEIILQLSYEEHRKFARELVFYPIDHPRRVRIEKALNEMDIKKTSK
tara:strand:+ start:3047 stop:3196 length:150 start_codon:yes stop_codon:yes gene_type:complete